VRKHARSYKSSYSPINYSLINQSALTNGLALCRQILPRGQRTGREYLALNPKRADRTLGSFRINLNTGKWADFATGEHGGDLISLVAWLYDLRQSDAALHLATLLNISSRGQS
jgi:hypothetical protein